MRHRHKVDIWGLNQPITYKPVVKQPEAVKKIQVWSGTFQQPTWSLKSGTEFELDIWAKQLWNYTVPNNFVTAGFQWRNVLYAMRKGGVKNPPNKICTNALKAFTPQRICLLVALSVVKGSNWDECGTAFPLMTHSIKQKFPPLVEWRRVIKQNKY